MQRPTTAMDPKSYQPLLDALLDSWNRNNRILINLLHSIPEDRLKTRAMDAGPSIAELFTHIHYVRLVFVAEDAPEFSEPLPNQEWQAEISRDRIADMLNHSAKTLLQAVKSRLESARQMDLHYDHPVLMLQHMIWHEGYHHGQIKLALKIAGHALSDKEIGPLTWGVWMNRPTT